MKAIDVLRRIRDTRSAEVLLFAPPTEPAPEDLEVASNIAEWDEGMPEGMPEVIEYAKPRLLVDMQTAHVIVTVYDALKPANQEKADRLMR